ncbi:MAG: 2-oxoglutarate dehydrogenase E1 component, partial [Myxococcales bacterium]|nr:2-oxoglutarate dehydrogenase E1 component [Myxococcales bacterium]
NLAFLEALYEAYQRDPNSIDPEWLPLLKDLEQRSEASSTQHHETHAAADAPSMILRAADAADAAHTTEAEQIALQGLVDRLIESYRLHGHTAAQIDPLGRPRAAPDPGLDPSYYGLDTHMDREFAPGTLMPKKKASLREILQRLRNTYTQHIGVEYWHLPDHEQRNWLQARMEGCENRVIPPAPEQRRLFEAMVSIDNTDKFIHSKFLGAKRFSISGAESMIAMLDCIIEQGGDVGIDEVVIGMAHRGRLNVLMNILGKAIEDVFSEFNKADPWAGLGSGDVKYHMGYFRHHETTKGKKMYLALAFNPSHLEAISPVNQGRVRGKQDQIGDVDGDRVMGVTLHGDAAFAGQGVVQETLNLSRLRGYKTGGSIRIVINNQVGFTTDPSDSRSTSYATDVAHMLEIPVFHVNGDDVEAAAYVARLAVDFRQRFHRDVIIDLVCYRRFGHNEGDDPTFTQPTMYSIIQDHASVRQLYEAAIRQRGTLSGDECEAIDKATNDDLDQALAKANQSERTTVHSPMHGVWADYRGGNDSEDNEVDTTISRERFAALAPMITRAPADFHVHRRLGRILGDFDKMYAGDGSLNWAAAELMAYAALLDEGTNIRMTGQDTQRGTFGHRHAVFSDAKTGDTWTPLANLRDGQGRFEIFNSPLSEFAVLGFEFGYSLISPAALVIWEAQFGDFCNGAQVIIDNFLSATEDKWNRLTGLVMMLPHGYEGQGPEHSSARLERFLQLCAEDN